MVSVVPSQQEGCRFDPGPGAFLFACSPCVTWVLSGFSAFLPYSINMHARPIGNSTLSVGVSVNECVFLCGPSWQFVQGVTLPSSQDSWDRLQQTPEC